MPPLRLKRLTTIFLQRCTRTTKNNIVKMYLCTRYYRSNGHTAINHEGHMEDNLDKIRILPFSSPRYIIIIIVTFLSVNLISYHRPSSTSCQQGPGTVPPN